MNETARNLEELYLRRPTPEYHQALDLAVSEMIQSKDPFLAVLSSDVLAVELLKRVSQPLHIASAGMFNTAAFVSAAKGWAWGSVEAVLLDNQQRTYNTVLWAEPEGDSERQTAARLRCIVDPGATLLVISSTYLRRFLPVWQQLSKPAKKTHSPRKVMNSLKSVGWRIEEIISFHGPRSLAWSWLFRVINRLGRPDWGDRCLFSMRAAYREPGWLWPLAPLALIRARAL